MPRVSVLLPVRNGERVISAAIRSVLTQTLADFELLVIDDASTDRTCDVVRDQAARDARVKLLRHDRPLGVGASLNHGLAACRAPIVARMGPQARSKPLRLERQLAWLDANPFTVLLGTLAGLLDANGELDRVIDRPGAHAAICEALASDNAVVPESLMWRRREIESIGMFTVDPAFAGAEDYELVVRVAARYGVENLSELLVTLTAPEPVDRAPAVQAEARVADLARELLAGRPEPVVESPARPPHRGRLFVSIASYRDPELEPTLRDLFACAARPDDITIGVCLQYEPRADGAGASLGPRPDQVRVIHAHVHESLGLGWARHTIERLWNGEEHVLQIDAHMRFADAWDERLLAQLDRCDSTCPVLTTYPHAYTPPRRLTSGPPPRMRAVRFTPEGLLLLGVITDPAQPSRPTPQAFFAGGFAFYPGAFLREVPTDPLMYFNDTEPTHMVRAWTHGWDLFAPSENLVHHLYGPSRQRTPLHWQDRMDWPARAALGQRRARHLLGMERSFDADVLERIEAFGMGSRRTLESYQRFAGVNFLSRSVSNMAREGRVNPRY